MRPTFVYLGGDIKIQMILRVFLVQYTIGQNLWLGVFKKLYIVCEKKKTAQFMNFPFALAKLAIQRISCI